MLQPKHTAKSVTLELIHGLEQGTIVVDAPASLSRTGKTGFDVLLARVIFGLIVVVLFLKRVVDLLLSWALLLLLSPLLLILMAAIRWTSNGAVLSALNGLGLRNLVPSSTDDSRSGKDGFIAFLLRRILGVGAGEAGENRLGPPRLPEGRSS
jgi:hypothetical protein